MSLVGLLIGVILICLVFWCVRALLAAFSVGEPVSTVIMVLLVVIVIVWLLSAFTGHSLGNLRIT